MVVGDESIAHFFVRKFLRKKYSNAGAGLTEKKLANCFYSTFTQPNLPLNKR
jgi:hypothetical protein